MYLSKKGIETREWIPPLFDGAEGHDESTFRRPQTAYELLKFWHHTLDDIAEDYTLGDLFELLKGLPPDAIVILSEMCDMDLEAFIEEANKPVEKERDSEIEFLHVHNVCELTHYEKDPSRPDTPMRWLDDDEAEDEDAKNEAIAEVTGTKKPFAIVDATGEEQVRLSAGEMNGKWVGPYHLSRHFGGWGKWEEPYEGAIENDGWDPNSKGGISVSFVKVNELLHLPLRYDPALSMRNDLYKGDVLVDSSIFITFGEFVYAILWELGWYGGPEKRDEAGDTLLERVKDLKDKLGEV